MREQLIRYLLGELEGDELDDLRVQLKHSPELQQELARLRECFDSNRDEDSGRIPPGRLAKRTADLIANSDEYELEMASSGAKQMSPAGESPNAVLGWSLADLTVAGGVMLAVSMLVFPALRDSRDGTRNTICQNNQYQLWVLVSKRAQDHGGYYPQVRPNENAGVYVARLVNEGYAEPESLGMLLVCPASQVASDLRAHRRNALWIPAREEIRRMETAQLLQLTANMSPCYGYRLSQRIGDDYQDQRSDMVGQSVLDPIFGDISSDPLDSMASHHRGSVIQIAQRDGSVRSITADGTKVLAGDIDLYHNDLEIVAAGLGPHDVVLAPSNAMPGLEIVAAGLGPHDVVHTPSNTKPGLTTTPQGR